MRHTINIRDDGLSKEEQDIEFDLITCPGRALIMQGTSRPSAAVDPGRTCCVTSGSWLWGPLQVLWEAQLPIPDLADRRIFPTCFCGQGVASQTRAAAVAGSCRGSSKWDSESCMSVQEVSECMRAFSGNPSNEPASL